MSLILLNTEGFFFAEEIIAEIKYKLREYGIYIEMNTCRFMHKKNSDYPNHIANSVFFSFFFF